MYRNIITKLKEWKDKDGRKPLVLAGARQTGKTYILRQFGEREFDTVAYINCDDNERAKNLFAQDYDVRRMILAISAITETEITPGRSLIIIDEIQEAPRGPRLGVLLRQRRQARNRLHDSARGQGGPH